MTDSVLSENESPSVGQILKTARLARALTLEDVSKSLFITKRQLTSLEEDAEHLSCDVYTIGFVRLYAQHLSLNVEEIIAKFKEQKIDSSKSLQVVFPAPLPGKGMPSFYILAFSLIALIAVILGWQLLGGDRNAPALPEIVLDQPSSTLLESSIEEDTAPSYDEPSALEVPDHGLDPIPLKGDFSLFEERAFPTGEHTQEIGKDVVVDRER